MTQESPELQQGWCEGKQRVCANKIKLKALEVDLRLKCQPSSSAVTNGFAACTFSIPASPELIANMETVETLGVLSCGTNDECVIVEALDTWRFRHISELLDLDTSNETVIAEII